MKYPSLIVKIWNSQALPNNMASLYKNIKAYNALKGYHSQFQKHITRFILINLLQVITARVPNVKEIGTPQSPAFAHLLLVFLKC